LNNDVKSVALCWIPHSIYRGPGETTVRDPPSGKVLREGGAEEFHFIFHLTFASVVFTELCGVWAESDFEIFQIVGGGVKK